MPINSALIRYRLANPSAIGAMIATAAGPRAPRAVRTPVMPNITHGMNATRPRTSRTAPLTMRSEERRVGKECRSRCDWSSDVCSSDLWSEGAEGSEDTGDAEHHPWNERNASAYESHGASDHEVGRASCRERV